jgi:hypothetical protein
MSRRPTARPRSQQRRSLVVIAVVVLMVVGLGFALIPGATAPTAPLFCPYGEVILNGVAQCVPARPS